MNTWLAALAGGALIGLAAVLLMWANGRIAGISGIANRVLDGPTGDRGWAIAFLAGMMLAGAVVLLVTGRVANPLASPLQLVVAGLLVGFGTRLGSGCTSGHGVCGIGRLSKRSFVAVAIFMVSAIATVYVVRHGLRA